MLATQGGVDPPPVGNIQAWAHIDMSAALRYGELFARNYCGIALNQQTSGNTESPSPLLTNMVILCT